MIFPAQAVDALNLYTLDVLTLLLLSSLSSLEIKVYGCLAAGPGA